MPEARSPVTAERIEQAILLLRGQKVMLDRDLASLYGVTTGNLNRAVTRNLGRFPADFMFPLTRQEFNDLIFHSGRSSWGGTRKLPRAFTEQGVAMLSSVLRSERAVQVNIAVMRAFVKLRGILSAHKELAGKLSELERKTERHDREIRGIFDAIRMLMAPPAPVGPKPKRVIGFRVGKG